MYTEGAVDACAARMAKGDQILVGILSGPAPVLPVMDLDILHSSA